MTIAPTIDWSTQQEASRQRSIAGGGKPGLARMEQLVGKSGREILEAMMSGELPYPQMNETMNMTLLEVHHGRAVFQGIPLPRHYNPLGSVHGGWFARYCQVNSETAKPPGSNGKFQPRTVINSFRKLVQRERKAVIRH